MTHEKIQEQLWALYDGELSDREKMNLELHLQDCGECLLVLSQWQKTSGVLFQKHGNLNLPDEIFVQGVMARVRVLPEPSKTTWRNGFLPWLAPLLGSAAIAGWVFFAVLPNTPGFSSNPSVETLFSNNNTPTVSGWTATQNASPSIELASFITGE